MHRFHVHIHVEDLQRSIAFYSKMFGVEPVRREADYAKWMLDSPKVNLAISTRGGKTGVDHLGIQAETEADLADLKSRANAADLALLDEGETTCCYARSEKYWVTDPDGVAWEQFHTLDSIPTFSEAQPKAAESVSACCAGAPARGKPVGIPVRQASSCC